MKVILLLLLVVTVALASRQQFLDFQHKYGKVYSSDEFQYRYTVFQQNLKAANKLNERNGNGPVFGVTKWMDLTQAEFKEYYLMKKTVHTDKSLKPFTPLDIEKVNAPTSFDWRTKGAVTPVYNQQQCGSCWAFSATENIESMWFLDGHSLTRLSMQQIVDCDTSDDGCNGGDTTTAYQYVISAGGLDTYTSYTYTGQDGSCQFNKTNIGATIKNWAYATQSQDEDQMVAYLYQNGPLSICVDAETWQYYSSGIIMKGSGCGNSLDHCVQAVGYAVSSTGTPYWTVRNSWGADWGLNGYLYVERGQNVCGIAQEATSAII